jgi:hypothetical protein
MSPHEQGDIYIEPERATTRGSHFQMREGGVGVWQSRRTPFLERAPNQALEEAYARRRGGGFASAKVHIYQALDGRVSLYYGETRLEHSAIAGGDSFMLPLG